MKKIRVQICDWCNKPHSGRKSLEDRCVCEGSGHYHWGEIEKESLTNCIECGESVEEYETVTNCHETCRLQL